MFIGKEDAIKSSIIEGTILLNETKIDIIFSKIYEFQYKIQIIKWIFEYNCAESTLSLWFDKFMK